MVTLIAREIEHVCVQLRFHVLKTEVSFLVLCSMTFIVEDTIDMAFI